MKTKYITLPVERVGCSITTVRKYRRENELPANAITTRATIGRGGVHDGQ